MIIDFPKEGLIGYAASKSQKTDASIEILRVKLQENSDLNLMERLACTALAFGLLGLTIKGVSTASAWESRAQTRDLVQRWMDSSACDFLEKRVIADILNVLPDSEVEYDAHCLRRHEDRLKSPSEDIGNAKTYIVLHPVSQLIKIGKSFDPDKRIHTLSTQSGAVLKVLLIIDSDVERELHSRFSEFRVHGEWFDDQQGLISEYVSEVQGGAA